MAAAAAKERKARAAETAPPQVGDVVLYELPSSGALRPAMVLGAAPDGGLTLSVFVTPAEGQAHGSRSGQLDYVPSARQGERGDDGKIGPGRWTWRE